MKKIVFFVSLVILLAFGFTGCDNGNGDNKGGGGSLTITNISSTYNNMYACFRYEDTAGWELWGATNVEPPILVKINNGSVVLLMWKISNL